MGTSSSSFSSTFVFDRGPAKYFHGRKQILHDFKELLKYSTQNNRGTTFLIQGAPGAGKTALLYECEKLAEKSSWEIVEISSAVLWNPDELQRALESKRNFKFEGGSAGVNIFGIGHASVTRKMIPQTVQTLLQAGEAPLLLTLDEAQILGKEDLIPPNKVHTVVDVLQSIHNGNLKRPVVLIAAGLGTTTEAFGALGISRFAKRCRVELGALGKEAEHSVLHDWLTEDGKATGDTTVWINTIAKETHGWPQHILSYVEPALDQLHADKGAMTAEGLATVLEAGRVLRTAYYKQRVEGFSIQQRRSFAKLFTNVTYGGSLELEDIMMSLVQDHGEEKAAAVFRRAEEKGVLVDRDGGYVIPIPSMHNWLVSNYARIQG